MTWICAAKAMDTTALTVTATRDTARQGQRGPAVTGTLDGTQQDQSPATNMKFYLGGYPWDFSAVFSGRNGDL